MCRFIAYKGAPILLDDLLFRPKNSLIKQSIEAKELEEPLNGDGFGVGWYTKDGDPTPAVFVSMTPAWSNRNLKSLASHIKSESIFAHVRAASVGDITESNCHPFSFENWMFMHNGNIGEFPKIKREVRRSLSDLRYNWLRGQTDSEHLFALILDRLTPGKANPEGLMAAIIDSIKFTETLKSSHGISEESYVNICISNGEFVIATRYCSSKNEEPLSLYYSTGSRYVCEGGVCRIERTSADERTALIVSEPLTDLSNDWQKVPDSHFVIIDKNNVVTLKPIELN